MSQWPPSGYWEKTSWVWVTQCWESVRLRWDNSCHPLSALSSNTELCLYEIINTTTTETLITCKLSALDIYRLIMIGMCLSRSRLQAKLSRRGSDWLGPRRDVKVSPLTTCHVWREEERGVSQHLSPAQSGGTHYIRTDGRSGPPIALNEHRCNTRLIHCRLNFTIWHFSVNCRISISNLTFPQQTSSIWQYESPLWRLLSSKSCLVGEGETIHKTKIESLW